MRHPDRIFSRRAEIAIRRYMQQLTQWDRKTFIEKTRDLNARGIIRVRPSENTPPSLQKELGL